MYLYNFHSIINKLFYSKNNYTRKDNLKKLNNKKIIIKPEIWTIFTEIIFIIIMISLITNAFFFINRISTCCTNFNYFNHNYTNYNGKVPHRALNLKIIIE